MKEDNEAVIKALNMYGRVPQQYELLNEIERLKKEAEKYKKRCYEALTLIRENYGLLDKYGIDMLDDILNGK